VRGGCLGQIPMGVPAKAPQGRRGQVFTVVHRVATYYRITTPLRHKSPFLDSSERRLQAEKKWGLGSSDHDFLMLLGLERTVDTRSKAAAELGQFSMTHIHS
jgi:hypothetical protein